MSFIKKIFSNSLFKRYKKKDIDSLINKFSNVNEHLLDDKYYPVPEETTITPNNFIKIVEDDIKEFYDYINKFKDKKHKMDIYFIEKKDISSMKREKQTREKIKELENKLKVNHNKKKIKKAIRALKELENKLKDIKVDIRYVYLDIKEELKD